jgi:hypothetical protein
MDISSLPYPDRYRDPCSTYYYANGEIFWFTLITMLKGTDTFVSPFYIFV